MTKKELKEIYYLDQEIRKWQKELSEIKNQSLIKGQAMSGMPKCSNEPADTVGNLIAQISDIEFVIECKLKEVRYQRGKIICFINQIEDSLTRQVMFYRYVSLMNWNEVAKNVGGRSTGDGIRKMHNRFMK